MSDAVNELGGLGSGIMSGLGSAASGIGSAIGGIPSDIMGMFGSPQGAGATASPTGPGGNVGTISAGGSTGTGAAAMPAAPAVPSSAGSLASANPADINVSAPPTASVAPVNADLASVMSGQTPLSGIVGSETGLPAASGQVSPVSASVDNLSPMNVAKGMTPTVQANPDVTPAASFAQQLMTPQGLMKAAGVGLPLFQMIQASQPSTAEKALKAQLGKDQQQSTLEQNQYNAAESGQIPQALKAASDLALQQKIAGIKQNYASAGLSGSSAEATDVANATIQQQAQDFQQAQQLAQSALSAYGTDMGQTTSLLGQILNAETAQGTEVGTAMADLLAAIGGTQRPKTPTVH